MHELQVPVRWNFTRPPRHLHLLAGHRSPRCERMRGNSDDRLSFGASFEDSFSNCLRGDHLMQPFASTDIIQKWAELIAMLTYSQRLPGSKMESAAYPPCYAQGHCHCSQRLALWPLPLLYCQDGFTNLDPGPHCRAASCGEGHDIP
jgi:hypothetical protein